MTRQDPGRLLLDRTGAREQALAREADQARTMTGDLAARLHEPGEATGHLRITRTTLLPLAARPVPRPRRPPRTRRCPAAARSSTSERRPSAAAR